MKIPAPLKTVLKRQRGIVRVYDYLLFLRGMPVRDLLRLSRLRLFFTVQPLTRMTRANLALLYTLTQQIEAEHIQGSFVQCGVWNGGSAGVIGVAAKRAGMTRSLWLFDSFEGLPEPLPRDINSQGRPAFRGQVTGQQATVERLLYRTLRLDPAQIHIEPGWFNETLLRARPAMEPIALLHIDCDLYSSTKECLEHLYKAVTPGGYVVIDDYGHWQGCRQAVDEFLQPLQKPLTWIDRTGVYFRK